MLQKLRMHCATSTQGHQLLRHVLTPANSILKVKWIKTPPAADQY